MHNLQQHYVVAFAIVFLKVGTMTGTIPGLALWFSARACANLLYAGRK
jgi:hypothetical protein